MRAITLHQPWATLMAIGAKKFETRSWAVVYRGQIAIHAGKYKSRDHVKLLYREPFKSVLKAAGYSNLDDLPFGYVIAVANLTHVFDSTALKARLVQLNDRNELAFGNFEPGRFCWWIQDVKPITPVPAQGKQGMWAWDGSHAE